jgi:hypothetical protein
MVKTNVVFLDGNKNREKICCQNIPSELFSVVNDLSNAQIICGHADNIDGYDAITKYSLTNPNHLIIVYSAGGCPKISDLDSKSKKVLVIERKIDRTDGISQDEWNLIHESIIFDPHNFSFKYLHLIDNYEYLISISILCQGFLTINAKNLNLEDSDIQNALLIMGDNLAEKLNSLGVNDDELKKKCILVSASKWWQEQLVDRHGNRQSQHQLELKVLRECQLCKADSSKLIELIQLIYNYNKNKLAVIDSKTVAKAFCAIFESFQQ